MNVEREIQAISAELIEYQFVLMLQVEDQNFDDFAQSTFFGIEI